jgi:hypothetical protein
MCPFRVSEYDLAMSTSSQEAGGDVGKVVGEMAHLGYSK